MESKSTTGALVLLGVTIAWDGMSKGNTDVIRLGAVVSLVSGLLLFYYINKHEHFSSRVEKWMKNSKLLGVGGGTKKRHLNTVPQKKSAWKNHRKKNKRISKRR